MQINRKNFLTCFTQNVSQIIYLSSLLTYMFFTHGLLLINDGIYFDGWPYHVSFINSITNLAVHAALESHVYLEALVLMLAYSSGFPLIVIHVIVFLSLFSAAILFSRLITLLIPINKPQEWLISAIFLSFPAYLDTPNLATAVRYVVALMLFLLATNIVLQTTLSKLSLISIFLAMFAFALSFSSGSLLSLFGLVIIVLIHLNFDEIRSMHLWKLTLTKFKFLMTCILPLVYWFFTRIIFPSPGWFATYNIPSTQNIFDLSKYWIFIQNGIFLPFIESYQHIGRLAVFAPLLMGLLTKPFMKIQDMVNHITGENNCSTPSILLHTGVKLLLIGLVTLPFSILPYVAVDKLLESTLFGSADKRLALLIPIPVSLIVTGLLSIIYHTVNKSGERYIHVVTVITLLAFSIVQIKNYVFYQAQWVKDRSIIEGIKAKKAEINRYGLFTVKDQILLDLEHISAFTYLNFKWTALFRFALDDTWPVAEIPSVTWAKEIQASPYFAEYLHLHRYDPRKCEGELLLTPTDYKSTLNIWGLSLRYWYYRFFLPNKLDLWLLSLSKVYIIGICNYN